LVQSAPAFHRGTQLIVTAALVISMHVQSRPPFANDSALRKRLGLLKPNGMVAAGGGNPGGGAGCWWDRRWCRPIEGAIDRIGIRMLTPNRLHQ
jgi:hypothetical protein